MKQSSLSIPTRPQAEQFLLNAEQQNPGPWANHSRLVADAAWRIAECSPGIDPEAAAILGLLHDVGRGAGVSDMRHVMDGYRLMTQQGYQDAARICLTHSFPLQDIRAMQNDWDGEPGDNVFIAGYLDRVTYDDYDLLIQLCDALALPDGFCLIEKRMVDVALRRGINDFTLAKWRKTFDILRYFEQKIQQSVYCLLPGVVESTFDITKRGKTAGLDER